jgi:polyisoprenoid-binding protein YceI
MKKTILAGLIFLSLTAEAQKYISEKSFVSFFSDALLEDITADNKKASSIINTATGDIAFSIPIKEFQFAKSLMQEHFNEKYLESETYPKSTFQGKLNGFDPKAKGVQNVKAIGKLTIHGVTKDVEIPGTIEVRDNKLLAQSKFMVKVADYKVEIPQLVFQNIAEQVEVTIDFVYKPQ